MRDESPTEAETRTRLLDCGAPLGTVYRYGEDPEQVYEVFGSSGRPLLIVVHGGYFRPSIDRAHARPQARALADAGYRVVLAEYRRIPGEPMASLDDLEALENHVGELGTWIGHSAGGTLVLLRACARSRPQVPVLALAPVADLVEAARAGLGDGAVAAWVGGTPDQHARAYMTVDPKLRWGDRLAEVGENLAPVVLAHGDADSTVPVELSTSFPAESVVFTGAHHFDLIDPDSLHWPSVLELVGEVNRSGDSDTYLT